MSGRTSSDRTASRRAIEALRGGVPSRDAVRQLGCNHPEVERRFEMLLEQVEASVESGAQARGLLISGNFGSGKSHLLEYLQHRALERHFACSKVVISKEASLADPVKLFRVAAAELRVPERLGSGVANVAGSLVFNSNSYADFVRWAAPEVSGLAGHFAGSLHVFQYGGDTEFRSRIERFWGGDPLTNRELGEKLRLLGQQATYPLQKLPRARDLAFQRFQFLARLVRAAGLKGWIILLDEVELVGSYTFKSRARGYAELARLLGALNDSPAGNFPGLGAVAAITSDFESAVITGGKMDGEYVPGKLRASAREDDHLLATMAERGMRLIRKDGERLPPLSDEQVRATYDALRRIYQGAFSWSPPADTVLPPVGATSVMRSFVRRWITEWDIGRLFPHSSFAAVVTPLSPATYRDDPDLQSDEPESPDPAGING